ncbi:MAG: response regulator [Pseudomonadota bacterium]|nr:response regulator [Pseudomonadota bacterium]
MAPTEAKKILVVDDSRTIRQVAETILTTEGYHVITAEDGYEALSVLHDHEFVMVFMDVMMPRLDGFQTCVLIKNHEHYEKLPIVMLSSKDGAFDQARGKLLGCEQYMTKPFTRKDILDVARQYALETQQ